MREMQYLCLVYHDEREWDAQSTSEYDELVGEILAYREFLRSSGHLVAANSLQHSHMATTLRVRNGNMSVTDGPFAETKEQLGGFFLVEARDIDEACEVASRFPPARIGTIEVRPVQELRHS